MSRFGLFLKSWTALLATCLVVTVVPTSLSATLADDIEDASGDSSDADAAGTSEVDTATADLDEITELLRVLNSQVNEAEAAAERFVAEQESLENQSETYETDIEEIQAEIEILEAELAERSIRAFQGSGGRSVLSDADPADSLRRDGLLASVSRSEREAAEELRLAQADLVSTEATRDQLVEQLEADAQQNAVSLEKFAAAQEALVTIAEEAEERAERALSEAEGLEGVDSAKAEELRTLVAALNQQIEIALADQLERELAEVAANPGANYEPDGTFPSEDEIVDAGNGIQVHVSIVDRVSLMLAAAEADGVILRGSGYRSHARQIELRRINCGPTSFDIYERRSSTCSPPTATPGNSMHEQGLAIDFSNGGGTISRGSAEFAWLTQNAATYGLQNLPSESWHWSVNGN